jgi:hypothetical protein
LKEPNARADVLPAAGSEPARGRKAGVHEGPHYAEALNRVPSTGEARLAVGHEDSQKVFHLRPRRKLETEVFAHIG